MQHTGSKNPTADLFDLGIRTSGKIFFNLSAEELVEQSLLRNQGTLSDKGALMIRTGSFTGRSPKDRFIVNSTNGPKNIDWGDINIPIDEKYFDQLESKIKKHFEDKDLFVKDAAACADPRYQLKLRLIAEYPWSAQFANNMFIRLSEEQLATFSPEWTILCAPTFSADPAVDGTRQSNFSIINFEKKKIIIGGTGYTGEIKKGIFSVLNYILPSERGVLSMHCSANTSQLGDTAVFFGLSGTGKTTLSADPNRLLIGDDEHGWSEDGVFNFEGGCYAKCIDLSEEKEPDIYRAIRPGAILENIVCLEGTNIPDYSRDDITQNTRVSYPIYHIDNYKEDSKAAIPTNIFFLTCDASGVFPPLSKLTPGQAMYHFISGYTAKVAGTEEGITEPKTTFSACFGAPFMPLHPTQYADMLGEKMKKHNVNIWLVNTGWSGGAYGVGSRIKLKYTRAMVREVLNGNIAKGEFETFEELQLSIPKACADVPSEILNPKNTWEDKAAYDKKAKELVGRFTANFKKFEKGASEEILAGAPKC